MRSDGRPPVAPFGPLTLPPCFVAALILPLVGSGGRLKLPPDAARWPLSPWRALAPRGLSICGRSAGRQPRHVRASIVTARVNSRSANPPILWSPPSVLVASVAGHFTSGLALVSVVGLTPFSFFFWLEPNPPAVTPPTKLCGRAFPLGGFWCRMSVALLVAMSLRRDERLTCQKCVLSQRRRPPTSLLPTGIPFRNSNTQTSS